MVDLNFSKLRKEQLTALLHRLKEKNGRLKDLTLSSNDLSQVINCLKIAHMILRHTQT